MHTPKQHSPKEHHTVEAATVTEFGIKLDSRGGRGRRALGSISVAIALGILSGCNRPVSVLTKPSHQSEVATSPHNAITPLSENALAPLPSASPPPSPAETAPIATFEPATIDQEKPGVSLVTNLAPGTTARYLIHITGADATENIGEMAAKSAQEWEIELDTVINVEAANSTSNNSSTLAASTGTSTITLLIDGIRANETFDTGKVFFDSAWPEGKDPGNRLRPMIEPLVGLRASLTLNERYEIVAITGTEKVLDRFKPTIRWSLRLFTPEAIATTIGPIFTPGMQGVTHASSTWTTQRRETFGTATLANTFTHMLDSISYKDGPSSSNSPSSTNSSANSLGNTVKSTPIAAIVSIHGDGVIAPNPQIPAGLQAIKELGISGVTVWDISRGLLSSHQLATSSGVYARPLPNGFLISRSRLIEIKRQD